MATTMDRKLTGTKPGVPGQRGSAKSADPDDAGKPKGRFALKGRKKLLLAVVLVVLLAGGGAAYWFLLGPGASSAEAVEPEPEPGEVLPLEPITINLEGGSYLQLGIALQTEAGAAEGGHGSLDGSQALDIAIELFSGRSLAELSAPEVRGALKAELVTKLDDAYHGHVYDVYFTEFVMQ